MGMRAGLRRVLQCVAPTASAATASEESISTDGEPATTLWWRRFAFLFATACALITLFAYAGNAGAVVRTGGTGTSPRISSDLPDYSPGATVNLLGGSWQPGEAVHIFGFGGSTSSALMKSVAVINPATGKTFDFWTSGDNKTDSGTTVPSPACVTNNNAGGSGNITDLYAHFKNANTAPSITYTTSPANANEGDTKTYNFSITDPDAGD